jgi:chemotaxis protein MotB
VSQPTLQPSIGPTPWIVTLLLAAFAGAGWAYLSYRLSATHGDLGGARRDLDTARAEVAALGQRVAKADGEASSIRAQLARTPGEVQAAKQAIAEKEAAADDLAAKLEDIISGEQGAVVRQDGGQMSLQLMEEVLFRSGEAVLTDSGKKVLRAVGEALNSYPDKQVWVQGHTDDVPISKGNRAQFASNWELSAARALDVVHFLQREVHVDPRRLAAVAFGEYRPVSLKKKAKNRRIEIVLFPKEVRVIKE